MFWTGGGLAMAGALWIAQAVDLAAGQAGQEALLGGGVLFVVGLAMAGYGLARAKTR